LIETHYTPHIEPNPTSVQAYGMSQMILGLAVVSCVVVGGGGIRHTLLHNGEGRSSIDPNPFLETLQRSNSTQELAQTCQQLERIARPTGYEWEHMIGTKNQDMLMSLHADEIIVNAMRTHPDAVSVQRACSDAMSGIAQWNGCPSQCGKAHRKMVMEDGILDLDAENIRRFPELLSSGPGAMGSFTDFAGPTSEIMERLSNTRISAHIVSQMVQHSGDGTMVLSGLCYFSNACRNLSISRQMVDAGFLEASPQWMRAHAYDQPRGVRGEVMWDVLECFTQSEEHLARLTDAGIIQATQDMLLSISFDSRKEDVLLNERAFSNALGLLGRLAEGNETRRVAIMSSRSTSHGSIGESYETEHGIRKAILRGIEQFGPNTGGSPADVTRALGILGIDGHHLGFAQPAEPADVQSYVDDTGVICYECSSAAMPEVLDHHMASIQGRSQFQNARQSLMNYSCVSRGFTFDMRPDGADGCYEPARTFGLPGESGLAEFGRQMYAAVTQFETDHGLPAGTGPTLEQCRCMPGSHQRQVPSDAECGEAALRLGPDAFLRRA
jgi:hypothetical protein